jgi:6-phosphofructokinase 1
MNSDKKSAIKRIAVFTSGGDAPGMNAAIRAVVRTASYYDLHVYGIKGGYDGMIKGDLERLERRDVGNIIHRGGTILKTARSEAFKTEDGRKLAFESLQDFDIDGCIAIGGNGTFKGADIFEQEYKIPFIGIPGTIDNDLAGTDYTVGFDTAVNTAIEAVDKIRDTADSHNRVFFVEVMGRNSGFIALNTGIGSGSSKIVMPEEPSSVENIVEMLKRNTKRDKLFSLIIVAEGSQIGNTPEIASHVHQQLPELDIRVTIIGHLQRGGAPTGFDRVLASRLGFEAVEGLMRGEHNSMVGIQNNKVKFIPFAKAIDDKKSLDETLKKMAEILSL